MDRHDAADGEASDAEVPAPPAGGFERVVAAIARLALGLSAASLLLSLVTIVYSVVRRYVFGAPVPWTDELVGYLLVASVMLAAADALLGGEHISVDILTERLAPRAKHIVYMLGLVAVAATAGLLVIEGIGSVSFSLMVGQRSNGALALPLWMPQSLVPIGAALLFAAALAAIVGAWRTNAMAPQHTAPVQGIE